MKKLLSLALALCVALALLPGTALAAATSGTCGDGVSWSLSDGTLTISGTGAMKNYSAKSLWRANVPWDSQRSAITAVVIGDGVTSIGDYAFYCSENLTSVTIPGSVTSIGWWAFTHCESLTSVAIPNGVTTIEKEVFCGCRNLTSVTIPTSVTSIPDSAFACPNLTDIYYGGSEGQWKQIPVGRGNDLMLAATVHYNSTGPGTPAAPSSPVALPTKFTDVAASSPFAEAINWAVEKSITTGKTDTTFAPGEECTNGQILTFLWRANGSPEPTVENPFTDSIPASFQKAAVWAYEKGLVSGTVFGASTPCTRAVTVEYLWKAAGSPAASESASFTDVPANADYAQAVAWAVENGVTSGTGGQFSPANTCTRGQIVTFLYRAMGK